METRSFNLKKILNILIPIIALFLVLEGIMTIIGIYLGNIYNYVYISILHNLSFILIFIMLVLINKSNNEKSSILKYTSVFLLTFIIFDMVFVFTFSLYTPRREMFLVLILLLGLIRGVAFTLVYLSFRDIAKRYNNPIFLIYGWTFLVTYTTAMVFLLTWRIYSLQPLYNAFTSVGIQYYIDGVSFILIGLKILLDQFYFRRNRKLSETIRK